jgi:hypothetical protein
MLKTLASIGLALTALSGCNHEAQPPSDPASSQAQGLVTKSAEPAVVNIAVPAAPSAYLEITLKIDPSNRAAAAGVYSKYKQPFLDTIPGAMSKRLLIRDEDVVVLHGFDSTQHASDYLTSSLFTNDVVAALKPLLAAPPVVRIYSAP